MNIFVKLTTNFLIYEEKLYPPHVLAIVIALLLFSSCAKDFLSIRNDGSVTSDIDAVKKDFENNVSDLREIDFTYTWTGVKTKSLSKSVITPQWDQSTMKDERNLKIYEIPLRGDLLKLAVITLQRKGKTLTPVLSNITTHMMVKYNKENGRYFYFIATMIGSNADPKERPIKYVDNRSFNGYIYISDLNGKCMQLSKSFGGVRKLLRTDFRSSSPSNQGDETVDVLSIQMYRNSSMRYCEGEASGLGHVHVEKTNGDNCFKNCPKRVASEACTCDDCEFPIGDVGVKPCPECKQTEVNCICCPLCHKDPCICHLCPWCKKEPCECFLCSFCKQPFCTGECRIPCYYCTMVGCDGRCIGGGGVGPTEPDKSCNDAKCPTCKKCLNPTKPNCVKCAGHCEHTKCQSAGCGKLIRTNTRAAMNCSHVESDFCSSSGPVCDCGERHVGDDGIPICLDKIDAVFFENKTSGYSKMWNWSIGNNKECKGYVLSDQTMIVRLDTLNNTENSAVGLRIAKHSKESDVYYIKYNL